MPHPTHDTTPGSICLCPTCIDDIPLFATSLTTLPQARAVTAHILAKHQAQLHQLGALTAVLEDKEPVIQLLGQQVQTLRERLEEYEGAATSKHHRNSSSVTSRASAEEEREEEEDAQTQIAQLKQRLRSERRKDHPAALRLRAASNHFANQALERQVEAEEEAREWAWCAERLRERVVELVACEQFLIDVQIWREMGEDEGEGSGCEGVVEMMC